MEPIVRVPDPHLATRLAGSMVSGLSWTPDLWLFCQFFVDTCIRVHFGRMFIFYVVRCFDNLNRIFIEEMLINDYELIIIDNTVRITLSLNI